MYTYIKRGDPSRVLFPCSTPVEEPLVPIDRSETIPGHYGGVVIGGRRTTSGRAWLGRGRRGKEERTRAGGNHSLSLFLAPSSCHSSMHSDSLCMRREICSSATEERVCTRNRATVRDNDGPITGNKRYQSRLFGRASRAFPRDCFFFLRCRIPVDFPS